MTRSGAISTVDVILTEACNLACRYCYQNSKRPERTMSWETLRSALDLLHRSRTGMPLFSFYGGEPLMVLPLIRKAVAYSRRRGREGGSLRFVVATNGTLLDYKAAAFLARRGIETQISFDGLPASQDLRERGTFERLDALLDRLRRDHPRWFAASVRLCLTLSSATIPHLAESVDYFLAKDVRDIRIAPLVTHDPGWRNEMIADLYRQFGRIRRSSLAHFRSTGRIPVAALRPSPFMVLSGGARRKMCGAGRGGKLTVDTDGCLHGCVLFVPSYQRLPSAFLRRRFDAMRLGSLHETGGLPARLALYRKAARAAEIFDGKSRKYSSYGKCAACDWLRSCFICPVAIGHIPGNEDPSRVPDFPCAFNIVVNRHRRLFSEHSLRGRNLFSRRREAPPSGRVASR